jgi:hypothetical protein
MHSATYKKQGAPDQRSLINYHLILFVHAELIDLNWSIIVLFMHSNHRHIESKGHLYIYIHQVFNEINSIFYKLIIVYYSRDKNYKVSGLLLSSDSTRLEKSYKEGHKIMVASYAILANASRSTSSMVKSLQRISTSRSGRWFLNSVIALATVEEITIEEESSRL